MIQCYFGNGKGKTTASVGAAIRYLGCEKKVLFVSFLKDGTSSELNILKSIPNLDICLPPVSYRLFDNRHSEKNKEFAEAYTCFFTEKLCEISSCYDMIVLDEILDVIAFGYLRESLFLETIQNWSKRAEIVLTGHKLSSDISEICDYISEITAKKHPFEKGIAPRCGIEY